LALTVLLKFNKLQIMVVNETIKERSERLYPALNSHLDYRGNYNLPCLFESSPPSPLINI
jgi:hypothetical protein